MYMTCEPSKVASKYKPFDLDRARAGDPIVTRNGQAVLFGAVNSREMVNSVIGWIKPSNTSVFTPASWDSVGRYRGSSTSNPLDLFMAPVKKIGWINLYRNGGDGQLYPSGVIHEIEDDAILAGQPNTVATVKIEWEE